MFYRVRVRVELQKILREIGMSGDPDDCHLTKLINESGIRDFGTFAKRMDLSIRDGTFYCIDQTLETTEGEISKLELLDIEKSVATNQYGRISSSDARMRLFQALNDEYQDKQKPW